MDESLSDNFEDEIFDAKLHIDRVSQEFNPGSLQADAKDEIIEILQRELRSAVVELAKQKDNYKNQNISHYIDSYESPINQTYSHQEDTSPISRTDRLDDDDDDSHDACIKDAWLESQDNLHQSTLENNSLHDQISFLTAQNDNLRRLVQFDNNRPITELPALLSCLDELSLENDTLRQVVRDIRLQSNKWRQEAIHQNKLAVAAHLNLNQIIKKTTRTRGKRRILPDLVVSDLSQSLDHVSALLSNYRETRAGNTSPTTKTRK